MLTTMRRYYLYITLLLSLLLPLHAAASTLLSAPTCPAKLSMTTTNDNAAPYCCDEESSNMDCQQMHTCQGCNIGFQLFSFSIPAFDFSSNTNLHTKMNTPFVALFDPASVWRPPTNS